LPIGLNLESLGLDIRALRTLDSGEQFLGFSSEGRGKRRWPRQPLSTELQVITETGTVEGRSVTLSDGGICLFAVANLQLGTEVRIEFTHPQTRARVQASGSVRNRAAYLYGVEFFGKPTQTPLV
jgi:PilZ domain